MVRGREWGHGFGVRRACDKQTHQLDQSLKYHPITSARGQEITYDHVMRYIYWSISDTLNRSRGFLE